MTDYNWAPYQRATYNAGGPQPGAVAISAYIKERFPTSRLGNIYSYRNIVGGSSLSHHAEGRAVNQMHPASNPSIGYAIVQLLGPFGYRLGIDHIICNKQPWSNYRGQPVTFAAAYPQGKVYTGPHPHKDHAHVGLTRAAAQKLTLATIKFVVEGKVVGPIEGIDMSDYITVAGLRFYDYRKWSSWAKPYIIKAIEAGTIRGKRFNSNERDRIFDAQAPLTREELAAIGGRVSWY